MIVVPIQMHVVALVPPVYIVAQFLWWGHPCVFLVLGKLGHGVMFFSFNWKETGLVYQSPKVPSKSNSCFLRSYSNFFWCLALRCLQLSLTIDWRFPLLYLASIIWVTCLVASNVLFGSMAKLLFSFSTWSVLAHWQDDFINGDCLGFKV